MKYQKNNRKGNTGGRCGFPFYLIKDWWININTAQITSDHSSYCIHTDR